MTIVDKNTANTIARVVVYFSDARGVDIDETFHSQKRGRVSASRFMIYAYLHNELGISANKIGKYFNRPRRSVLRGIQTLKNWMQYHSDIKNEYDTLIKNMGEDD